MIRQMGTTLEAIARDHVARYEWAASALSPFNVQHVLDAAAGTGYGAKIMAERGLMVTAIDNGEPAARVHREHFAHPGVDFVLADLMECELPKADAAVSLETIEHLPDAAAFLKRLRGAAGFLIASVPNEAVQQFNAHDYPEHVRHYTKDEFAELLMQCGWEPVAWFTQYAKHDREKSAMRPGDDGRVLGVVCQ